MKKRVLAILLALAMVAALLPAVALADGAVAKIDDKEYKKLNDAIGEVQPGQTIKLLQNVHLDETNGGRANISSKNFILDLGGFELSRDGTVLNITDSTVVIKNGTIKISYGGSVAINCAGTTNLTIDQTAEVVAAGDGDYGILIANGSEKTQVTVNGKLTGYNGLTINGNVTTDTNTVTIGSTASINVSRYGLYLAGNGKTTIENGSSITGGSTGIEIRAGELIVNGGTITGNSGSFTTKPNTNGTTTSGAGIAVVQHTTEQQINVVINNGNISGYYALFEADTQGTHPAGDITLNVSGGSFIATNSAGQAISSKDVTGFVSSGTFSTNVSEYVKDSTPLAQVNNGNYIVGESNIQAAVASAPYGSTVTVLKGNVNLSNVDTGTTVTNTGGGAVTVNGSSVQAGSSYTVERYYIPPVILTQPQSTTATEGGVATFSVSAINPNNPWNPNDLSIRWMISYDGGTVWKEFAVGPTAELPVTMEENGMLVQCRVNSGTEVRLDPVTVTVLPGMDIVPGEEEIIDPGEEEGDVQEGTEETPPEETVPEEGLEELPEEGDVPAEEEPVDVPKTGDSLPSVGLALVLGLAACAAVLKKARAK